MNFAASLKMLYRLSPNPDRQQTLDKLFAGNIAVCGMASCKLKQKQQHLMLLALKYSHKFQSVLPTKFKDLKQSCSLFQSSLKLVDASF